MECDVYYESKNLIINAISDDKSVIRFRVDRDILYIFKDLYDFSRD